MKYLRRKRSQDASLRVKAAATAFAVGAAVSALSQVPARADDSVAADGAVGVNASWEAGKSPTWFVELQQQGIFLIDDGIRSENDAEIRQGLLEFDWAFKHQAADGSFAGTAGGGIGQEFHSTSLFLEAAARAAIELKSYSPTTYTLDADYYSDKIAQYTAHIDAAAKWMTQPVVVAADLIYDYPYTHRRYLTAATLVEAGALTGDSDFAADAVPYVENGLSRQLGTGWTAAVTKNADGTVPPAVLQAPGVQSPPGTWETLTAVGVNPEKNGYDTEYQCTGLFYASIYYKYCTDPTMKKQLLTMIRAGLNWESGFVADDGTVGATGDSRVGVEDNRDGDVKVTTKGICWGAFDQGAQTTGDAVDQIYAARIASVGAKVDTNYVWTFGAVDGNEAWEHKKSLPWFIANQKIAVDYVEQGIAEENDNLIQEGLLIFRWGFVHQKPDGSFGFTQSPSGGGASFVEAIARAANDLQHYEPLTYQPTTNYAAWASDALDRCVHFCNWLTKTSDGAASQKPMIGSSSRNWAVAAALSEVGSYAGVSDLQDAAQIYAANAIALQLPSGEEPEKGALDINNQALGLNYSLRYAAVGSDASEAQAALASAYKGLNFESHYIAVDGTISGTPSPARVQIQHTFGLAATLPDKSFYQIVRCRLGDLPVE